MLNIEIKTIDKNLHRYETCGDYFDLNGVTHIRVSEMGDSDSEFLVALHELCEWYLTKRRGISEESITKFDVEFERNRSDNSEPGDSWDSPYRKEHRFAENIERMVAHELGVDWHEYDKKISNF